MSKEWSMIRPWHCPRCHGQLLDERTAVRCTACLASYPCFDGIPDLRLDKEMWIDLEEDRQLATHFASKAQQWSLEETLRRVFQTSKVFNQKEIETRVRRVFEGIDRLCEETDGWLREPLSHPGLVMDLGCGPGQLMSAAARSGRKEMIGVDVRLLWLVVAKRLIEANGGSPILAAGLGEALPLANKSVAAIISLDVIEHVSDVRSYLSDIDRVTEDGGCVALSTPNRYSLAAEPHIGVWGVGWVPRRWQKQYVKLIRGCPYEHCSLLSVGELNALLNQLTRFKGEFYAPPIPQHEIARFSARRKMLAAVYNSMSRQKFCQGALLSVGSFFRVVGRKPEPRRPAPASKPTELAQKLGR